MKKPERQSNLMQSLPENRSAQNLRGTLHRSDSLGFAPLNAMGRRTYPLPKQFADQHRADHTQRVRCYNRESIESWSTNLTRPVVVAVDDEPDILMLVREALEREGIEVHSANSVTESLSLSEDIRPDVYVIDLTLPDGNGFDLVRKLRERHDVGIVILTGRGEETDNVLGLELGADDYVVKPFRTKEFAARVHAVMRRYRRTEAQGPKKVAQSGETDSRFGEYSVSTSSRLVWDGDGHEIFLTTAEFDLLCALVATRGRVVSRDHLMSAIKGRDWEAYDRAIDGLVSRLRKKLPAGPGRAHFIRTVHGVGYSFTR